MKRLHVHVAVDDLATRDRFLLGAVRRTADGRQKRLRQVDARRSARQFRDLDARPGSPGSTISASRSRIADELHEVYARLHKAGGAIVDQGQTTCCYAKSEKSWIDDPAGISWETFLTTGESTDYGDGSGERVARVAHETSCCAPEIAPQAAACGCATT